MTVSAIPDDSHAISRSPLTLAQSSTAIPARRARPLASVGGGAGSSALARRRIHGGNELSPAGDRLHTSGLDASSPSAGGVRNGLRQLSVTATSNTAPEELLFDTSTDGLAIDTEGDR